VTVVGALVRFRAPLIDHPYLGIETMGKGYDGSIESNTTIPKKITSILYCCRFSTNS
jgi:hypothetical protein